MFARALGADDAIAFPDRSRLVQLACNGKQGACLVLSREGSGKLRFLPCSRQGGGQRGRAVALYEVPRKALDQREKLRFLDLRHFDQAATPEGSAAQPAAGEGEPVFARSLFRFQLKKGEGAWNRPFSRFGGQIGRASCRERVEPSHEAG